MSRFDFDTIIILLDGYFSALETFTNYMLLSLNDLLGIIGLELTIPAWLGGDLTPFVLMMGVSLPAYLIYQFITWVLNVIT